MIRAIILDRDGVINDDLGYIGKPGEFVFTHNAEQTLKRLRRLYLLIVISNQSGLSRGFFSKKDLEDITKRFRHLVDAVYYCVHHPDEDCECRKPKIHMLNEACKRFRLKPSECIVVGDKPSDVEMGKRAGCKTVFVDHFDSVSILSVKPDIAIKELPELEELMKKIEDDG